MKSKKCTFTCPDSKDMPYFFLLLEPPSFTQKLNNMDALLGTELTMVCVLKGSLPMTVSWTKGDHEVKDTGDVQISFENRTAVLHFLNVKLKHSGKYACHAQNEAGSQTCTAALVVKGLIYLLIEANTFLGLII